MKKDDLLCSVLLCVCVCGVCVTQGFIKFAVFLFHEDCGPSLPHSVVASEAVPTSSGHAHISESDRPAGMAGCVDSSTKDEEVLYFNIYIYIYIYIFIYIFIYIYLYIYIYIYLYIYIFIYIYFF